MSRSSSHLQDVSTLSGSFCRFWFRWKFPFLTLLTLIALGIMAPLSHLRNQDLLQSPPIPQSTFVISGSKLLYHGDPLKFETRYFDPLPPLPPPPLTPTPITSIEIKWVRLSGPNFTSQLAPYASTLQVLHLSNVTISGLLSPQPLPALVEFFLSQGLQPEETNSPEYFLTSGITPWLRSTLFFLLPNNASLDFDFPTAARVVYTSGLNVTIFLKGSLAYQLNPGLGEVRLDLSTCHPILQKLPQTYKILTLGRCKDLVPSSISPTITFLNLYIVYLSDDTLGNILRGLIHLEELYAEIPDGPTSIRLQDLPNSLRLLSISSMRIQLPPAATAYGNIKEFYFGGDNQYGWLEDGATATTLNNQLFKGLGKIFPNLEKVGIFDVRAVEQRWSFLDSALKAPTVRWIVAQNFARGLEDADAGADVEKELGSLGLGPGVEDFLIELDNSTGLRRGRELEEGEKLMLRYNLLGWGPIDSWPKYLYVQRIIRDGGILGGDRRGKSGDKKL